MSAPAPVLQLQAVEVHYGLSHVLQGVDLDVRGGEVVGLFGRNGVGKTTIVKAIAGWVAPSSGEIRFQGEPIHRLTPDQICRRGIGLVPEDRRVFPGLTVEENLRLGGMQVRRRPKSETNAKLEAIYARFPRLADRRRQLGTTLSGGEQQMLAIARVLMGAPKLLLIDEPLEGLAPMIVDDIFQLMIELRDQGIPLLLIEQNVKRALEICDRHYAIERGRVVHHGESANAEDRERLIAKISV
jgi:branched-chain amino acid transport system ATP-binding protein